MRSPCNEKPVHHSWRGALAHHNLRKPKCISEDPEQPKNKLRKKENTRAAVLSIRAGREQEKTEQVVAWARAEAVEENSRWTEVLVSVLKAKLLPRNANLITSQREAGPKPQVVHSPTGEFRGLSDHLFPTPKWGHC